MIPVTIPHRRALLAAVLLAIAGPALAHHGWGSYDAANPVTIEGEIVTLSYGNPHASLTMRSGGEVWTVTLAPVSRMRARGATETLLAAGGTITVFGYRSRSNPQELRAERITVGGKTIEMR